MTRRAIIRRLRADLETARRDLWQMAEDVSFYRADRDRLQAIVDRQDQTIMELWAMLELANAKFAAAAEFASDAHEAWQQPDDAPSGCVKHHTCHPSCSASYAEGCGAYVKGAT